MRLRDLLTFMVIIGLSACATPAQRQYGNTIAAFHAARDQKKACVEAAARNPNYAALSQYLPINSTASPSLEQMASTEVPTKDDLRAMVSWHHDIENCRQQLMEQAQQSFPFLVSALEQNNSDADAILLKLMGHEITWGAANTELAQTKIVAEARTQQAGAAWVSEMKEDNREQLDRRQVAAQNFQRAMSHLGQSNPVVVNAYRPPVNTTCTNFGATTNCTSQ